MQLSFFKEKLFSSTSLIILGITIFGSVVRLLNWPDIPYGLHQDEMNAGYEAWSLLNFGTDRWGNAWPVYFPSWGSGQNVLYSYYLIPFIALLGPTDTAIRMGMLIVGIILPILVYFLAKLWTNTTVAIIASAVSAIFPEFIRGSRWAVESNFVPFLSTLALLVLSYVILRTPTNKIFVLFSLVPLALLPYAYLITIVPVSVTLITILVWKRNTIKKAWKSWVGASIIFTVIVLPLVLFVGKLTIFGNEKYFFEEWLPFSIPALEQSRYDQLTEDRAGFWDIVVRNFSSLLVGRYQDQIGGGDFASHIPMALVFMFIIFTFIPLFKAKLNFTILHLWVLACLPVALFVPLSNIRGNMFYVSSIILISYLIWFLLSHIPNPKLRTTAGILLIFSYTLYVSSWYVSYQTKPAEFFSKDFKEIIYEIDSLNQENLPVLIDAKSNLIQIPDHQLMWLFLLTPDQIADNANPALRLGEYYFDKTVFKTDSEYYEVINNNFVAAPCDIEHTQEAELVIEGDGFNVYKCPALF